MPRHARPRNRRHSERLLCGGAHPLEGPEAAAASARRLLAGFRAAGDPVFHVRHVWAEEDATFMRPGTEGVEINERVAPLEGEAVISKEHPNSFRDTSLESELRAAGVDELVVCGMMTSMCVDATVRAAVDLGFETAVVHDACATCDLEFEGQVVPAAAVHAAFLAALGDGYAAVVSTDDIVKATGGPLPARS